MDMSRRTFTIGTLATGAAVAVPGAIAALVNAASIPQLIGDGVHDDRPAFDALAEGRPVTLGPGLKVDDDGWIDLGGRTYRIGGEAPVRIGVAPGGPYRGLRHARLRVDWPTPVCDQHPGGEAVRMAGL